MPNAGAPILVGDTARWICKATQGTQQTFATSGVFADVTFDDADTVDTLGIHDPVTNNARFVIGLALGWWEITGVVQWLSSTLSTQRRSHLLLNGATPVNGSYWFTPAITPTATSFVTTISTSIVQASAATDYVTFQAMQETGASLTTRVSGDLRSQLTAKYLGT